MATRNQVEWVGSITKLAPAEDAVGETQRELLVFLAPGGPTLLLEMDAPAALLADAATHLRTAIDRPLGGEAHTPARLRVASGALADALRPTLPVGIALSVGHTPEVDAMLQTMRDTMLAPVPSFLPADLPAGASAAFFRATAGLYRAEPWASLPDDESLLVVSADRFDLREAPTVTIGDGGKGYGILLFRTREAFDTYVDAAYAIAEGGEPSFPPHLALTYGPPDAIQPGLRDAIDLHQWEIASPSAYATLTVVEAGGATRPAYADEITMMEAVALALTALVGHAEALRSAREIGAPFEQTFPVVSALGPVDMTLAAAVPDDDDDDVEDGEDEQDDDVLRAFEASPEGEPLEEPKWAMLLSDCAAHLFDANVTTLTPANLRVFLSEIIVQKVAPPPAMAPEIITELRAFYTFLARTDVIDDGAPYLELLGPDAAKKLETLLLGKGRPRAVPTKEKKDARKAQRSARKRSR